MNRWWQTNLLLGLCVIALLTLELWPQAQEGHSPLTRLQPADITQIRIERDGRLQLSLRHLQNGWQLDYPRRAAAEARRVQQLLAITRAPVLRQLETPGSLDQYGLDSPTALLMLNDTRLLFGAREPTQRARYVLLDGQVHVIDDLYFSLLTLPASHFERD